MLSIPQHRQVHRRKDRQRQEGCDSCSHASLHRAQHQAVCAALAACNARCTHCAVCMRCVTSSQGPMSERAWHQRAAASCLERSSLGSGTSPRRQTAQGSRCLVLIPLIGRQACLHLMFLQVNSPQEHAAAVRLGRQDDRPRLHLCWWLHRRRMAGAGHRGHTGHTATPPGRRGQRTLQQHPSHPSHAPCLQQSLQAGGGWSQPQTAGQTGLCSLSKQPQAAHL